MTCGGRKKGRDSGALFESVGDGGWLEGDRVTAGRRRSWAATPWEM